MSLVTAASKTQLQPDDPSLCAALRVPPEILVPIFRILQVISRQPPLQWIIVTHVCRFWRDVALNRPSFWTRLHHDTVPLTRPWIEECIRRSSPLPLWLHYDAAYDCASSKLLADVTVELTDRIGTLAVRCHNDFLVRLNKPAPLLRELVLWHPADSPNGRLPVSLFGDDIPLLRDLELSHVSIPLGVTWLSQLRRLELGGKWGLYDANNGALIPLSISSFLHFLSLLPLLEDLTVQLPTTFDAQRSSCPPCRFPHLTSFDIQIDNLSHAGILKYITVERSIALTIKASIMDAVDFVLIEGMCQYFAQNAFPPTSITWDWYSISFATDVPRHHCFILKFNEHLQELTRNLLPLLLPSSKIRTLHLRSPFSAWLDLQTLETIEEIHIRFDEAVLRQLLHYPSTPCPFPSLRWVHLQDLDMAKDIDDLKQWVVHRGPTKLEGLCFRGCTGVGPDDIDFLSRHVQVILKD